MIVYLIGVLFLLFVGAVRLVNWVRYRRGRFSLIELLLAMTFVAVAMALWKFAGYVQR
jgi:Ca2+/Na+ antiporter